jgi:hypothetical protein
MEMTSTNWKLATALGLAGAIALSVPSAEARGGRNAALGFGIAAGALALGAAAAAASQPRYYYDNGPYAYQPYGYGGYSGYDSYNYYGGAPVYYGSPGYYNRSRGSYDVDRNGNVRGTNYNPNGG